MASDSARVLMLLGPEALAMGQLGLDTDGTSAYIYETGSPGKPETCRTLKYRVRGKTLDELKALCEGDGLECLQPGRWAIYSDETVRRYDRERSVKELADKRKADEAALRTANNGKRVRPRWLSDTVSSTEAVLNEANNNRGWLRIKHRRRIEAYEQKQQEKEQRRLQAASQARPQAVLRRSSSEGSFTRAESPLPTVRGFPALPMRVSVSSIEERPAQKQGRPAVLHRTSSSSSGSSVGQIVNRRSSTASGMSDSTYGFYM